jgi:hypothetical protein
MKYGDAHVVVFADMTNMLASEDLFESKEAAEAGIVALLEEDMKREMRSERLESFVWQREKRCEAIGYQDGRNDEYHGSRS